MYTAIMFSTADDIRGHLVR